MKRKHLLDISIIRVDNDLNIIHAQNPELVGRNLEDLFATPEKDLLTRMSKMRKGKVFQEEVALILKDKSMRYSFVVRKGLNKYDIALIELEHVYKLIENVALYKKYAFTDNLTGALTRHGYWNELFELLNYSEKFDHNLGVIFIDIDNLKRLNSEFGYKVGDDQIAEVSKTVSKALRKHDILVRLGGDEFLALLTIRGNKIDLLNTISQRILRAVRANKNLKTTVSIGTEFIDTATIVQILKEKDVKKAWEKQIDRVDEKVRLAKTSGKNKAVL